MKGTANGWNGTLMTGTITLGGEPYSFTGWLMTSPAPTPQGGSQFGTGYWSLHITILAARTARVGADFPAMIAMQNSMKVDQRALTDQTNRVIAQSFEQLGRWQAETRAAGDAERNRIVEQSMANAKASRDVMDRSTAAFINYINDETVVKNANGVTSTVSNGLAALLQQGPSGSFTQVPVSQYVKGQQY
jgi:hypothetical protein